MDCNGNDGDVALALDLGVYPVGTSQTGAAPTWYALLFGLTASL